MFKTFSKISLAFSIIFFTSFCSSMKIKTENKSNKIITYSDLPFNTIHSFKRIRYDFVFLFGLAVDYNQKHLDRILNEELEKIPEAKGIKNLKIRSYNSSNTSFQVLYFPGGLIGVFTGSFLFISYRNIEISGDIF